MKIGSLIVASSTISLTLGLVTAQAQSTEFSPYVNESGEINMPKDFRLTMVHLGSWKVPKGDASGFHDVYTERESALYFRENGEFPDGATLVKELRPSKKDHYTTGQNVGYASLEVKQWFVMVKDTKGRFEQNALWGDGWGWALFKPAKPQINVATNYKVDCLGCHMPAKQHDYVYTEAYPTLFKIK